MSNKKNLSVSLTDKERLWGYLYLAAEFLVLPTALYWLTDRLFPGTSDAAVNFLYYIINFLIICIIFRAFLKRNLGIAKSNLPRTILYILLGLAAYWASNLLMAELTYLLMPDFINVNDLGIAAVSRDGYFLMALGTVLVVPTAEECMFRGLLFRGIYGKSRVAAYLISALCFCLIHVANYIGSYELPLLAMCFVQYLPAGLILAWSYEKSNTILTPIAIHTVINAIGIYAMR